MTPISGEARGKKRTRPRGIFAKLARTRRSTPEDDGIRAAGRAFIYSERRSKESWTAPMRACFIYRSAARRSQAAERAHFCSLRAHARLRRALSFFFSLVELSSGKMLRRGSPRARIFRLRVGKDARSFVVTCGLFILINNRGGEIGMCAKSCLKQ